MTTPPFILELRRHVGHDPLWLSGVTAIVTRRHGDDRELLLVRRAEHTHEWTPVMGILEPGEQPAVAAAREVREETAVRCRPVRLTSVRTGAPMQYENGDRCQFLDLTFLCEYTGCDAPNGQPLPADGENVEAGWFAERALPPIRQDIAYRVSGALAGREAADFDR